MLGRLQSSTMNLLKLDIDITTLRETQLTDTGTIKDKNYIFYWKSKDSYERTMHSVGFAVKNTLLKTTFLRSNGSPRILTLCINTTIGPTTIVSAYATTLADLTEEREEFYGSPSAAIEVVPKFKKILLGDFNARVSDDNIA